MSGSPVRLPLGRAIAILEKRSLPKCRTEVLRRLRDGRLTAVAERFRVCLAGTAGGESAPLELSRDNNVTLPPGFWTEAGTDNADATNSVDWSTSQAYWAGPSLAGYEARASDDYARMADGIYLDPAEFAREFPEQPRGPKVAASRDAYVSPWMVIMAEAIERFGLPGSQPKKAELVAWFTGRPLPGGGIVSANQADFLATFCRDPEAMKGGNKRV